LIPGFCRSSFSGDFLLNIHRSRSSGSLPGFWESYYDGRSAAILRIGYRDSGSDPTADAGINSILLIALRMKPSPGHAAEHHEISPQQLLSTYR
jgi:hypothetical protein